MAEAEASVPLPKSAGWEHFSHVADIGVHGFGPTPESAFEQAALAVTSIVTDLEAVRGVTTVRIRCEAPDLELLLADWLNALVYEMATRDMLFREYRVRIRGGSLRGSATGEKIDVARHQPAAEVKGATLSELSVQQTPDELWHARCIMDV